MGVQLTLQDIQSGFLTASAFNANNTLTEEALNKALDRTSNTDNAMEVDLDMGLFNINNVAEALLNHQAINYGQAQNILAASGDQVTSTADKESFIATTDQSLFTFSSIEYVQNVNALIVFINGVYQLSGTDYTESSPTSITFNQGLQAGDVVVVIGARFNAEVFLTGSQAAADAAAASAVEADSHALEAEHWANYPVDQLVPEGDLVDDYSSLHWATKSQEAAGYKLGINTQAGTSYQLVLSDAGDLVRMTNAGANTVTVPTNATVAFEIGTIVNIRQSGAGTTTVSPAGGVTINAPLDEFTTDGEEFGVAIVKVGTDEWDLVKSYAGVRNDSFDSSVTGAEGSSGYQKLPSGLELKWGKVSIPALSAATVTFDTAFPTALINAQVTMVSPYASAADVQETGAYVRSVSASNMVIWNSWVGDSNGTALAADVYWFAIGV